MYTAKNRKKINVAMAGQPNCGKSTMFNAITGSTARVGNYPGITVEHMEGYYRNKDYEIKFTDLPGTYSLTSYSMEEVVARNFILNENPDIVVCMLDAVALERSLYLVVQLLEMGIPLILGLNMMDEVRKSGTKIDVKKLSEVLNIPVVECVARKGLGCQEIISKIMDLYSSDSSETPQDLKISYGPDIDPAIRKMTDIIESNRFLEKFPSRWLAIKYMEEDENILAEGGKVEDTHKKLMSIVKKTEKHTEMTLNTYPEALIADYRYGFIQSLLKFGIINREHIFKHTMTEKIDKFLTHRIFGPIFMIFVLYVLFAVTFNLGAYPQEWLQSLFSWMGDLGDTYIQNKMLNSLVVSGIIDGVGAVLSFAPLILIMFSMLCFLEDLGYMARIAYMLDRVFKAFGLHGSSVMPFIIAGGIPGGCAVPGVMTARNLRSPKERIATVLTAPFMVCGAKTTVYLMLSKTFFPQSSTFAMLIITAASWGFALIVAKILRSTIIRGAPTPFIMELPPYRLPTLYGIITHTLDRVWQFVKKAGTIIFSISIVMWALMTFPQLPVEVKQKFEK
ncbi:MAG: ferrous iron transport protein B, partial [Victivallales bacterium]|nr:ferrous iron transport protein B [Victivallales bacterium]